MVQEINSILAPLIGEPLSDMWRYCGMQKFEFGAQRPFINKQGKEVTAADWGLVVGCFWQISGPSGIVVSARDFGSVGAERSEATLPFYRDLYGEPVSSEEFERWRERRDEHAEWFYELLASNPPVVKSIDADKNGGLTFHLAEEYTLEVLPRTETDDEQWRFMPKEAEGEDFPHYVMTGLGEQTRLNLQDAADSLNLATDQFRILPFKEIKDLARRIQARFVDEPGFQYIWEAYQTPNAAYSHFPEGDECLILPRVIPSDTGPVWFIIDNASFIVCEVDAGILARLINECWEQYHWAFEYYIAPRNLDWFIGATRDQRLFAVEEPVASNLRREVAG